jgi:LemA protein
VSNVIIKLLGLGALFAALVYTVLLYNGLVRLKNNIHQAWANIDVLLKQRHEELPNLVAVCKQYMQYEQKVLESVVRARAEVAAAQERWDVQSLGAAESELRKGLAGLYAVAEGYADLKADRFFRHLQERISQLEKQIADRREYYNEAVNSNNSGVEQFPDLMIARLFGFQAQALLSFEPGEKTTVLLHPQFRQPGVVGRDA